MSSAPVPEPKSLILLEELQISKEPFLLQCCELLRQSRTTNKLRIVIGLTGRREGIPAILFINLQRP